MGVLRCRGIIIDVSIRRTIESLLGDEQQQEAFRASPEAFFADHGIEDIPGELIGTAFVHYSDTAPIEAGDAVAGIATHFSVVPFETDDLPDLPLVDGDNVSPFATLGYQSSGDIAGSDPHDEVQPSTDQQERTGAENAADDRGPSDRPDDDAEDPAMATDDEPLDATSDDPSTSDDLGSDVSDDVDSASFHDHAFDDGFNDDGFNDDGFSDGFDEAEALDNDADSGFGDGVGPNSGPAEILGEIHGGGPIDPEIDDPFFEEVTHDAMTSVPIDFEPIDFEQPALDHDGAPQQDGHLDADGFGGHGFGEHGFGGQEFADHGVEAFDDVDPSDLDLDDF